MRVGGVEIKKIIFFTIDMLRARHNVVYYNRKDMGN